MSSIATTYLGIAGLILLFYVYTRKSYRTSIEEFKLEPTPCPCCNSKEVRAGVLLGHKHLRRPLFSLDTDSFIPKHFLKLPKVGLACLECGHFWAKLDPTELEEHVSRIKQ